MFELYSFKKTQNGGKNDYDILDSAAQNFKNKNEDGEGSTDQKLCGKFSLLDILLALKSNQQLEYGQHHTIYLHTTRLLKSTDNFDDSNNHGSIKRKSVSKFIKPKKITIELEVTVIDQFNANPNVLV
jgi:hypothetical protein